MRSTIFGSVLLIAALSVGAVGQPPGVAASGASESEAPPPAYAEPSPFPGFATPDDAVREYVEGVAAADIERILRTSAFDEKSRGFRLDLLVDQLGAWPPSAPGPAHAPFFADILRERLRASQLDQVKWLAFSLLAPDRLGESLVTMDPLPVDVGWARDFMAELDPARLSGLDIVDVGLPKPELYLTLKNLEIVAESARQFGADEQTDRVALLSFEDELYAVGFTLLRHGDGWKVSSQSSVVSGLPVWGAARRMTADEFELLTSGR